VLVQRARPRMPRQPEQAGAAARSETGAAQDVVEARRGRGAFRHVARRHASSWA
jgi:hypothetical protein